MSRIGIALPSPMLPLNQASTLTCQQRRGAEPPPRLTAQALGDDPGHNGTTGQAVTTGHGDDGDGARVSPFCGWRERPEETCDTCATHKSPSHIIEPASPDDRI